MSRHKYTEEGCSCGCISARFYRQRLVSAKAGVAQLQDFHDLGPVLYVASDRFRHAERITKNLLHSSLGSLS